MKVVRNLLISSTEPTDTNVGWLKPLLEQFRNCGLIQL